MLARRFTGPLLCLLLLAPAVFTPAYAVGEHFMAEHIKVLGLQRISRTTVLTYMPGIGIGQSVGPAAIATAIRNLYRTGFFSTIEFRRKNHTLIIVVRERPTIARVILYGNKAIKTKSLRKALQQAGLTSGQFFDRSALDAIKQSLIQEYFNHGLYGVQVKAKAESLSNNRVAIRMDIKEGAHAKVLSINFTGNKTISNSTLRERFKLTTPGWFTWITGKDKYEEAKLRGSLENIRSYYMNRGYADFRIKSVQVQISPNKNGIYINVNLHEGGKYRIGSIKLLGSFPILEKKLQKLIFLKSGRVFSMQLANSEAQVLTNELGNYGYGFAKVNPIPRPDPKTHRVELVFYVTPGPRVYVRHITFSGAPGTNDAVFRRQMRQLEGTWLNNINVKRSRILLQRLPFVETADIKPVRVPGSTDQVDLNVKLQERQSGTANVYLSYSGFYGLGLGGQIALSNFLGEGKIVHLNLNRNTIQTNASLSYTNPYATVNGVSQTTSLFYSKGNSLIRGTSSFLTKNYGGSLSYGFPLSEFDSYSLGVTLRHGGLTPYCGSPAQFLQFVSNPNNGNVTPVQSFCRGPDPSVPINVTLDTLTYNNLVLKAGFAHDTRNRTVLPTRGTLQQVTLKVAVPPGSQRYWIATWNQVTFVPLGAGFIYGVNSLIGVGTAYGKTSDLPPTDHFFAGGPDSVAGYTSGYLGPTDSNGYPYGGNFVSWVQNELVLPNFFGDPSARHSYRLSLFLDMGNVFARASDFNLNQIRASYGIGVTWLTPIGALRFSYAVPFRTRPGDNLNRFQFTMGAYF